MTTMFYSPPYEFAAVQWKGDNLEEVQAFCGTRASGDWDIDANQPHTFQLFNEIGTYLIPSKRTEGATGEVLDVEAKVWRPVNTGDWIVQQEEGFVPCTDEWIRLNKIEITPEVQELLDDQRREKSFEVELTQLLNRHSIENESGTPDFVLAAYLMNCLKLYNETITRRSAWRGESVELPALQQLAKDNDGKEVPLVIYTDGQRNEVGTAKLHVTPGEVHVTGTITGAIPTFAVDPNASYSIGLNEPIDEPKQVRTGLSTFDRYISGGLADNGGDSKS